MADIVNAAKEAALKSFAERFNQSKFGFIMGFVDSKKLSDVTMKHFYQSYLTQSKPLVVNDGCKDWPGFEKWKDQEYLVKMTKLTQSKNYAKTAQADSQDELNENLEQIDKIKEEGLAGYDFSSGMPFLQNLWIFYNQDLEEDYQFPEFLHNTIKLRDSYLSYYNEVNNDELKGFAKQHSSEVYSCVTQGVEIFRLVAPYFKRNMYSGVREELKPNVSPVDLFHEDVHENLSVFPLLRQIQLHEVVLTEGQCLYIPAWWWSQSKTISDDGKNTLMIDFEYAAHSELYDQLNQGIELDLILGDDNDEEAYERLSDLNRKMNEELAEIDETLKHQRQDQDDKWFAKKQEEEKKGVAVKDDVMSHFKNVGSLLKKQKELLEQQVDLKDGLLLKEKTLKADDDKFDKVEKSNTGPKKNENRKATYKPSKGKNKKNK